MDVSAPSSTSISIASGASYTNDATPTLTLSALDSYAGVGDMRFSCDNSNWTDWIEYATSYSSFNMITSTGCSSGDGTKTIYVQYRDDAYTPNVSSATSDSIYYDTTGPTLSSITMGDYTLKSGQSTTVYFTFSDVSGEISGFTSADITSENGSITNVSGSGLSYTATFTANATHDELNQITVGTDWTDIVGNAAQSGNSSSNYTITPPYVESATYNANEGSRILTITFDEIIDASATDLSKIHIRESGESSGGVTLTDANVTGGDSTTITITTTEAQRISIKALGSRYLDLDASAIFELDNIFANEADNDNTITYTTDTTKPTISNISVDDDMLTEDDVDENSFHVTIVFSEIMHTDVKPVVQYLDSEVNDTLSCNGLWEEDDVTFVYSCEVLDDDVEIDDIDISVTGAKDVYTQNRMDSDTESNVFDIDTIKPEIDDFTINEDWVGEDDVGSNGFYIDLEFSEAMDQDVTPGLIFDPLTITTLDCEGEWSDSINYTFSCIVSDVNVTITDINIEISNATDVVGNELDDYIESEVFNIDTITPTISIDDNASEEWTNNDTITSNPDDDYNVASIKWIIRTNNTCGSGQDVDLDAGTDGNSLDANDDGIYGNKYICFRVKDNADNVAYISSAKIEKLDTTNPITSGDVNFAPNGDNNWYVSDVNYTITPFDLNNGADLNSGVADTNYCIDSNNTCVPDTAYTETLVISEDGNYYIRYYSWDNAGNLQSTQSSGLIKMDQTNPVTDGNTSFAPDGDNDWYVNDVNYIITESDATSLIADTNYCTDSNNTCVPDTAYESAILLYTDGNHYVRFRSVDNAGNLQSTQSSGLIKIDQTNPSTDGDVNFSPDGDNNWYVSDVNFTITESDATSLIADTNYCIDSNNTCVPDTAYTETLVISEDGNYYIRYYSWDNAGNLQSTQSSGLIKMDQTNPVTSADLDATEGEDSWYVSDVNYTITELDATSLIADTNYCTDSNNTCVPDTAYTESIIIDEDGNYYIRYYSWDNAGNLQSTQSSGLIKTDLAIPDVDLNANPGSDWVNNDFNIVFDVNYGFSDYNSALYWITWPDGNVTNGEFETDGNQYYLEVLVEDYNQDGEYILDYNFIDNAGNENSDNIEFYIDLTAPIMSVSSETTTSSITLTVHSDDDANCRYDTNTSEIFENLGHNSGLVNVYTWNITGLSDDTTYTYLVMCRNVAGDDSNEIVSIKTNNARTRSSGGSGGGSSLVPGTIVVLSKTESLDVNKDVIRETLKDMKDDQNKSLYTYSQINEMVNNSEDYEFKRTVLVEKITSDSREVTYKVTITTSVKNNTNNNLEAVKVVLEVPKSIATDATQIVSLIPFTVLVNDPVLEFNISELEKGETANISYSVTSEKLIDVEKIAFSEPVVRDSEIVIEPVKESDSEDVVSDIGEENTSIEESNETTPSQGDENVIVEETQSNLWYWIIGILIVLAIIIYYVSKPKKEMNPLNKR